MSSVCCFITPMSAAAAELGPATRFPTCMAGTPGPEPLLPVCHGAHQQEHRARSSTASYNQACICRCQMLNHTLRASARKNTAVLAQLGLKEPLPRQLPTSQERFCKSFMGMTWVFTLYEMETLWRHHHCALIISFIYLHFQHEHDIM